MFITEDDIATWNGSYKNKYHTFTIPKITEEILPDEFAGTLEYFVEDNSGNKYSTDEFNTEYLGCLYGKYEGTKTHLVGIINLFFEARYKDLDIGSSDKRLIDFLCKLKPRKDENFNKELEYLKQKYKN